MDLDPFPGISVDELNSIAGKYATKEDVIIHFNLAKFVDQAMIENKGFLELPQDKQYEMLMVMAEEISEELKPEIDPNMFNDDTGQPGDPNRGDSNFGQ